MKTICFGNSIMFFLETFYFKLKIIHKAEEKEVGSMLIYEINHLQIIFQVIRKLYSNMYFGALNFICWTPNYYGTRHDMIYHCDKVRSLLPPKPSIPS